LLWSYGVRAKRLKPRDFRPPLFDFGENNMKTLKDDNKKYLRIFTELMNKVVGKDKKVRKFKIGKIAMENEGDLAYNQAKAEIRERIKTILK
jgi:hypothetical protein